jgi:deoxyribose-phosphate aldolase
MSDQKIATYEDLAGVLEHSLLRPELTETDVARGCDLAKEYQVSAVLVRQSDVDLAVNWMKGSAVALGSVADWPHGNSSTSVKTYSVRDMLRRGAKEIDTVMNTGKLVSRQFQYLEMELVQMADACHQAGAVLKVSLQSEYLDHELKIVACRIVKRAGVDYLASSALDDFALLAEHLRDRARLKASGPVESLEEALRLREAGCTRIASEHTPAILEAWKARLAEQAAQPSVIS